MREMKITNLMDNIDFEAQMLCDELGNFSDGLRMIMLLQRAKDGGNSDKDDKRMLATYLYSNKIEFLYYMREALYLQYLYQDKKPRIYISVNRRDMKKSIRNIEERLIEGHYANDNEAKDSIYRKILLNNRSFIMKPQSRLETLFLLDIDDVLLFDGVHDWCAKNNVKILLKRRTKQGWHFVTEPFNPNDWDKNLGEIKKDALLFIK